MNPAINVARIEIVEAARAWARATDKRTAARELRALRKAVREFEAFYLPKATP